MGFDLQADNESSRVSAELEASDASLYFSGAMEVVGWGERKRETKEEERKRRPWPIDREGFVRLDSGNLRESR